MPAAASNGKAARDALVRLLVQAPVAITTTKWAWTTARARVIRASGAPPIPRRCRRWSRRQGCTCHLLRLSANLTGPAGTSRQGPKPAHPRPSGQLPDGCRARWCVARPTSSEERAAGQGQVRLHMGDTTYPTRPRRPAALRRQAGHGGAAGDPVQHGAGRHQRSACPLKETGANCTWASAANPPSRCSGAAPVGVNAVPDQHLRLLRAGDDGHRRYRRRRGGADPWRFRGTDNLRASAAATQISGTAEPRAPFMAAPAPLMYLRALITADKSGSVTARTCARRCTPKANWEPKAWPASAPRHLDRQGPPHDA